MDLTRTQSLTDVIHDSIEYSGIEREILGTPIFNRLHRVLQSSLVFLTYPSNKTKRFEHSVGVMDLAGRMFFASVSNTDPNTLTLFLQEIKDAISKWRETAHNDHLSAVVPREILAKYTKQKILSMPLPENSLYSRYLPENISKLKNEDKAAYYITFQAIRIAGLLHDVGHMPYSHILEHAMNSLYSKVRQIPEVDRNENQQNFLDALFNYCDPSCEEKDEIHEEIGKICANKIFECIANLTERNKFNLFFVATYDFACSILQSKASQNNIFSDLHKIIAGIVDADRLDYCSRDAFCSGTRKDIINYKRLLSTYSICLSALDEPLIVEKITSKDEDRQRFYFCPHVKNVPLIEELLNRRWDIFSLINYHHNVHKHEILFEEAIVDFGYDELLDDSPIGELSQGSLPLKIYSIWQLIGLLKGNDPPEYLLIQFDDSWLDTLLKRKFFKLYQGDFMWSQDHANQPEWNRYDELISSQKHYYSVFKRAEDFRDVDRLLFAKVLDVLRDSPHDAPTLPDDIKQALLKKLKGIEDYKTFLTKKRSLFFRWLFTNVILLIAGLPQDKQELLRATQDNLNEVLSGEDKIQNIILRDCTFKLGCASAKNKLMVSDNGEAKLFQNYSIIEQILKERRAFALPVHLYYLPKHISGEYPTDDSSINKKSDIYPQFVDAIWKSICDKVNLELVLKKEEHLS